MLFFFFCGGGGGGEGGLVNFVNYEFFKFKIKKYIFFFCGGGDGGGDGEGEGARVSVVVFFFLQKKGGGAEVNGWTDKQAQSSLPFNFFEVGGITMHERTSYVPDKLNL